MASLLALGGALSWGVGDFLGGIASRRIAVVTVLAISQAAGLAGLLVVVWIGIVFVMAAVPLIRVLTTRQRHIAGQVLGVELPAAADKVVDELLRLGPPSASPAVRAARV